MKAIAQVLASCLSLFFCPLCGAFICSYQTSNKPLVSFTYSALKASCIAYFAYQMLFTVTGATFL